jgi:hypothetical protein
MMNEALGFPPRAAALTPTLSRDAGEGARRRSKTLTTVRFCVPLKHIGNQLS